MTGVWPAQGRCGPVFNSPMKAAQEAVSKHSADPCGTLLSRTGTTAGNSSATSTQLPPS